jgi:hypothetical protein
MKNYLDGGEAILEAFRKLKIDYIMSSPGSEWSPLWEALARQKLDNKAGPTFVESWHETLAVNMATGYTLVTGRPQAVACCREAWAFTAPCRTKCRWSSCRVNPRPWAKIPISISSSSGTAA